MDDPNDRNQSLRQLPFSQQEATNLDIIQQREHFLGFMVVDADQGDGTLADIVKQTKRRVSRLSGHRDCSPPVQVRTAQLTVRRNARRATPRRSYGDPTP